MTTYVDVIKLFHNLSSGIADEATCSVCFYMGQSSSAYNEKVQVVGWDDDPELEWISDRNFVNNQLTEVPNWSKPENYHNIAVKGMVAPQMYRTAEINLDGNYTIHVTRYLYPIRKDDGRMPLIPATTVGSLDLI